MNYFVVADVHGYYYELINALNEKGFNPEDENHKLIVCGDLMDRGPEAVQLQKYILELMERDKVILIKGNHEDLILDLIINIGFYTFRFRDSHHYSNGTIDTCEQLVKMSDYDVMHNPLKFVTEMVNTPFIKTIIPAMKNYFETEHYILSTDGFLAWLKKACILIIQRLRSTSITQTGEAQAKNSGKRLVGLTGWNLHTSIILKNLGRQ